MRKFYLDNSPGDCYLRNRTGSGRTLAALTISCLGLNACTESPPPEGPAPAIIDSAKRNCVDSGRLRVDLTGGIRASLEWQADEMVCEGMPRPDDAGARIRLSGPVRNDGETKTLTFILGLPNLGAGVTGAELPTNVTLVEEGTGQFFVTPDTSSCWTDVTTHRLIEGSETEYVIGGSLYCVSPLPELNGSASVTFTELSFTGRLNWDHAESQLGKAL